MMKDVLNNMVEMVQSNKGKIKKIIIIGVVLLIIGSGIAVGSVYTYAKSNINYTEKQLKEVAIKAIPGQLINVKKELEFEDAVFEYTFQIKDSENIMQEITVSSKSGAIIEMELNKHNTGYEEHDNNDKQDYDD